MATWDKWQLLFARLTSLGTSLSDLRGDFSEETIQLLISSKLPQSLKRQISLNSSTEKVALIDLTCLSRVYDLLKPTNAPYLPTVVQDDFLAVADLCSFVASVIFYDSIVVIEDYSSGLELVPKLNELLNVDSKTLIKALKYDPYVETKRFFNSILQESILDLHEAYKNKNHNVLMVELEKAWKELLSTQNFPTHKKLDYDHLNYYESPDILKRDTNIVNLFITMELNDEISKASHPDHSDLIRVHNLRSYFYLRLAQCLDVIVNSQEIDLNQKFTEYWTQKVAHPSPYPSIRYIGGCLRYPMINAWEQLAKSQHTNPVSNLERELQQQWSTIKQKTSNFSEEERIDLPFWMDALLAKIAKDHSQKTPQEKFIVALKQLRNDARAFRKSRIALEKAFRTEDSKTIDSLQAALLQDTNTLSDVWTQEAQLLGTALTLVTSFLTFILPPVHKKQERVVQEAISGVTQACPISFQLLKYFNPDIHFVYQITKESLRCQNSFVGIADHFQLSLTNDEGRKFLDSFGALKWYF